MVNPSRNNTDKGIWICLGVGSGKCHEVYREDARNIREEDHAGNRTRRTSYLKTRSNIIGPVKIFFMKSVRIVLVLVLAVMLGGCSGQSGSDCSSREQTLAEFAFCPQALDKYIYFEMDATAVDAAEPDLVVWIVSRESQISDSAGWERLGSVCTPEKLLDLYENKAAGCGAKGFQMNIDAADEQGCRQVFLRVSAE